MQIFRSIFYLFPALFSFSIGYTCTAFQLKSLQEDQIYCRSLEFADLLNSEILLVGRGISFIGSTGSNEEGLAWKSKFGFIGINSIFERKYVCDGMNEKGLIASALFLPGFAQYQELDAQKFPKTIGYWQLPSYILSTCASIQEVKNLIPNLIVGNLPMPNYEEKIMPLHFYFSDSLGNTLVVEYVDGKCYQWQNTLGVLTNSPPFAWHIFNLSNYINLSSFNVPKLKLQNMEIHNPSQGSGLLGLPGDYTSASRFVKAALFSQWAAKQPTALETVKMGFHILNTFDIFDGIIKDRAEKTENKDPNFSELKTDITQWIVVHDKTNLKSYIRTYENLEIQFVDIKKIDFAKIGMKTISLNKVFAPSDITSNAKLLENP
ncbi:MAG: linear amide C-N hydrolase [Chlamydiae bacterium]|nr:linear amide C-N hydrolase [Chlamydiota bacterium]